MFILLFLISIPYFVLIGNPDLKKMRKNGDAEESIRTVECPLSCPLLVMLHKNSIYRA
jgi:hypothetical protein